MTIQPVTVELTWYEREVAEYVARRKEEESTKDKRQHRYEWNPSTKESLSTGIQSVGAEIAVAKLLDRYWVPGINTFKGADVSVDIQVRWTRTQFLIVRPPDNRGPGDADDEWFYMVAGEMPVYEVWGYILGKDAKQDEWFGSPNKRPPAWFVPKHALAPVDDKELVA